jgi:hypothetical protein
MQRVLIATLMALFFGLFSMPAAQAGSSEWLGRRLGVQGDLAARCDLLSASLSSAPLSSLSSLSLVIGLLYVFSSRAAGCKLVALILRGRHYSGGPEFFNNNT